MKKALLFLVVLTIVLGCSSQRHRGPASSYVDSTPEHLRHCYDDLSLGKDFKQDPFYRPFVMTDGPYKGECVDNRKRRSIFILGHEDERLERDYGIKPKRGHLYFVNFKHQDKYHLAEFRLGSIQDTYLVFEKFFEVSSSKYRAGDPQFMRNVVLSGHAQLRFRLKRGRYLRLYPQIPRSGRQARPILIDDFAYAMFAVRPLSISGQTFDPLGDGVSKGYILSHNFMSTYDVALTYKDYVTKDTEVSQFLFERGQFDGNKAFEKLLDHSHRDFVSNRPTFYHTWYNNCVTSMYIGIDAGAKKQGRLQSLVGAGATLIRPAKWRTGGKEWNPMFVLTNLTRRGIIKGGGESEVMSLNQEICHILKGDDFKDVRLACRSQ